MNKPFRIEVHERDWKGFIARMETEEEAAACAVRCWDDALPYNTIHVIDERTNIEVGYARHAGDGSAEFVATGRRL